ncbi:UDP-N-acetylmuramate dehydrogenase [Aurantivibrio plasticivorans]
MTNIVALNIITNFSLDELNTLGVPATAGNYVKVTTKAELKEALKLAKELNLRVLVLGGGSNVVLPELFVGLVIHINIKGIELVHETNDVAWLRVGAGEVWQDLVDYCLNFHYWGLENLSLIPGTVGAAPIQNIGAYGVELKDVFVELKAVECNSMLDVTFTAEGCQFGYRDSVFKQHLKDHYIITDVTLKLNKHPKVNVEYPALKSACEHLSPAEITPVKVSQLVSDIRRSKLPDPKRVPNAGSFFKNPFVSSEKYRELQERYPDIVAYPVASPDDSNGCNMKLAAGWLLEKSGWKGRIDHGIGMHSQQALVLTNEGHRASRHIIDFAQQVQRSVDDMFGVMLEIEPRVYLD